MYENEAQGFSSPLISVNVQQKKKKTRKTRVPTQHGGSKQSQMGESQILLSSRTEQEGCPCFQSSANQPAVCLCLITNTRAAQEKLLKGDFTDDACGCKPHCSVGTRRRSFSNCEKDDIYLFLSLARRVLLQPSARL